MVTKGNLKERLTTPAIWCSASCQLLLYLLKVQHVDTVTWGRFLVYLIRCCQKTGLNILYTKTFTSSLDSPKAQHLTHLMTAYFSSNKHNSLFYWCTSPTLYLALTPPPQVRSSNIQHVQSCLSKPKYYYPLPSTNQDKTNSFLVNQLFMILNTFH